MLKLAFGVAFRAGRPVRLLTIGAIAVLIALESPGATAWAQTAEKRTDPAVRPEFREPVTLTSKDGVLEAADISDWRHRLGRRPRRSAATRHRLRGAQLRGQRVRSGLARARHGRRKQAARGNCRAP